jgi:hypothetical protein
MRTEHIGLGWLLSYLPVDGEGGKIVFLVGTLNDLKAELKP